MHHLQHLGQSMVPWFAMSSASFWLALPVSDWGSNHLLRPWARSPLGLGSVSQGPGLGRGAAGGPAGGGAALGWGVCSSSGIGRFWSWNSPTRQKTEGQGSRGSMSWSTSHQCDLLAVLRLWSLWRNSLRYLVEWLVLPIGHCTLCFGARMPAAHTHTPTGHSSIRGGQSLQALLSGALLRIPEESLAVVPAREALTGFCKGFSTLHTPCRT